ncbi:MAG TPA: NfeD family protein [Pedococcus sp.]|jgi:membrane protein implicated in regulation of membrane protease activity
MEWVGDNPWLAWVGIALVLGAIEAATVDFVFVMLAAGALGSAVAAAFGAPFAVQIVVGIVVAVVLLLVARPWLKRRFNEDAASATIGAPGLVGRTAYVLQTVTATDGRVKLGGETWSARLAEGGAPCTPGQEVRVVSIQGATVIIAGERLPDRGE